MEQNTHKIFEDEIVESLLNEIEISILRLKNKVKETAAKSIRIISTSPRKAVFGDISNDTIDQLEKDTKAINELISEIQKQHRLYKYVKNNRDHYSFFFTSYVEREILMMNDLNEYINQNFTKKELDKDDK